MKAKRNLFLSLVTLVLLLCCSMFFVACNGKGGTTVNDPTYLVTFKVDGRNYDIVLVEKGKTVTLPASPEKDGYTCDGWYADEACSQGYTASAVSQSIDVYAKFTANVYTITYETDGGTHTNTASTFTVEDKITLADAQKSGYIFDGWYLNGERVSSVPKGTTGNITLTAKYVAVDLDTHCVSFLVGGKNYDTQLVNDGSLAVLPTAPENAGYTFGGWYTDEACTNAFDETSAVSADINVYAKMTANVYTITYQADGGMHTNTSSTFTVEDKITLTDAQKSGYIFDGWYLNGERVSSVPKGTTGNITLSAKYTAIDPDTYCVSFLVGGKNYDMQLVKDGSLAVLPTAPENAGYTFGGWFTDEACTNAFDATSAVSTDIKVYAKMTANVYTITYEADGGTHTNTATTFTVEDKVTLSDAQKAGYLFKGWKNGDEYMTSIPKGTTGNVTLTAVFEKDGYFITYENVDDAYCKNPKKYAVDDESFELNPAYKDGYIFDGWYTNEQFTGKQVTEITQGSTGDLTLYAKFTLIEANIVYLNTKDVQHSYATKYSVEQPVYVADLEKAGYTFLGWFDEYDNKVTVVDFDGFWGTDVTLTAKWQVNTYTITYEDVNGADNAENKTTFTVEDGTISFADLADRGGLTFAGWSFMNGTPVTSYTFDVSERYDDIVLTAKWNTPDSELAAFTYVVDDQNRITITGIKDKTVTELVVPDYVYSIDIGAFKDCTGLKKLTVPYVGNLSNGEYGSIGYLFGAKSYLNNANVMPQSLTEVTVTGGYGNDETMKTGAFYNCFHLENVVIQDGVTYMGRSVFYDNIALENITLPFVGDTEKYNQSDSYFYPFSWVFGTNTAISDMMMSKDSYAYEWKTYWNNENNGISCIGHIPNSLKTVTINNGIIGISCFDSYTNVENIILGEGVTHIGERAFADSYNLKIITIPDSVIHIDSTAFSQTPFGNNLKADDTGCIYINNVLFKYVGSASELTIKDGTISISNAAFEYNTSLTSVKCPSSLKYI